MTGLGASWKTSMIGYFVIVITVAQQVFVEQGLPQSTHEWITFVGGVVTGIGIAVSKDADVSNAQRPMAVAQPVVAFTGDKMAEIPVPTPKE